MPSSSPALPARKAGGKRTPAPNTSKSNLPIGQPEYATLEDGTQVPIMVPPGMPPVQAQAVIAYLKANPAAAKAAYDQAQQILKNPALANAILNLQNPAAMGAMNRAPPAALDALKDDPEFKHVFDDVAANGPAAFQKYWEDEELMIKISQKIRAMNINSAAGPQAPSKPKNISNLHDAAKYGDLEAAKQMIADGKDVNQKTERGIRALGVAVGHNQIAMVKFLLDNGADLHACDAQGNTVLHYAAGYGRVEICQLLVEAGADIQAQNNAKQTPLQLAQASKEALIVAFLTEKLKESEASNTAGTDKAADAKNSQNGDAAP